MNRHLIWISTITLALMLLLGIGVSAMNDTPECEGYVVQPGQTLATIAAEYGIPTEYLAQYNRLRVNDALAPGQVIVVPIFSQLTPETTRQITANTPEVEQVTGMIGITCVKSTRIMSGPNKGRVLFDGAIRGTELLVLGESGNHYVLLMSDGSTGYVPKNVVTLTQTKVTVNRPTPAPQPPAAGRQDLVNTAFKYLGVPYKYGGKLPDTVDCSLLIQTVFAHHGIRLPRTAAQQYAVGTPVEVADLQAGDRLYFITDRSGKISHTGMYIGDGRFIHASSNRRQVDIDNLADQHYWKMYAGARR